MDLFKLKKKKSTQKSVLVSTGSSSELFNYIYITVTAQSVLTVAQRLLRLLNVVFTAEITSAGCVDWMIQFQWHHSFVSWAQRLHVSSQGELRKSWAFRRQGMSNKRHDEGFIKHYTNLHKIQNLPAPSISILTSNIKNITCLESYWSALSLQHGQMCLIWWERCSLQNARPLLVNVS